MHRCTDAGTGPRLALHGVSYRYLGRFPALDDVSLAVHPQEKVALLGANGSGKSTLLKVLDGLVFPDDGVYEAFGAKVTEANLEDEPVEHLEKRRFAAAVGPEQRHFLLRVHGQRHVVEGREPVEVAV